MAKHAPPRLGSLRYVVIITVMWLTSLAGAQAATFHVSADLGDDDQDGSAATPWQTIGHAIKHVPPAATIQVHDGVYNEHVEIGAAAGALILRAAPGTTPIIDGHGLSIPNAQHGLITLVDVQNVRIQGFELRNYRSSDEHVPVGIQVRGHGRHIEILDNHIHHIETQGDDCDSNALGIAIYGDDPQRPIRDIRISDNELDHLRLGCSESLSINGNVEAFTISRNHIHDNNNIAIDAIGFEGISSDPTTDQARSGRIVDNVIERISARQNPAYGEHGLGAVGIYVDGGHDIVIAGNRIAHTDIGIELASEHAHRHTRDIRVQGNLIMYSPLTGLSIGGYEPSRGGTRNVQIIDNVFYRNDTEHSFSGEFQIQHNAADNRFEHNRLYANAQGLFVSHPYPQAGTAATLDHNLFQSARSEAASIFVWNGTRYDSAYLYQSATGNDRASIFGHGSSWLMGTLLGLRLGAPLPITAATTPLPLSR